MKTLQAAKMPSLKDKLLGTGVPAVVKKPRRRAVKKPALPANPPTNE